MKKRAVRKVLAFAVLSGILGSCIFNNDTENEGKKTGSISVMTWNMQALFDGVDDGNEYDEYKASAGWTPEKYSGRITAISRAIGGMNTVPDIIAMQEIESVRVMEDLANSLSNHGYSCTHFANNPGMSLGLGILSRLPISESKTHSISIDGDTAPRPVLEVRIEKNDSGNQGESFVLFICHWKSKLGSEELTENTRRASARIILRRIRELANEEPAPPVIVLGDLNENYDEFYRRNGEAICALLPDDPRSAELTGFYEIDEDDNEACTELQKDFIILSKHKPPKAQYFTGEPLTLYSPWTVELENGSYYYKNNWETIDHFLLSSGLFSGSGWEFDNCSVVDYPPFTNSGGHPAAYNPRTGSGLSDHLPLLLFLRWQDAE
jgi:endonuclease/exonuclease/phosphatase family metal-dependent hydrolase